jgi:hypothetical protein
MARTAIVGDAPFLTSTLTVTYRFYAPTLIVPGLRDRVPEARLALADDCPKPEPGAAASPAQIPSNHSGW